MSTKLSDLRPAAKSMAEHAISGMKAHGIKFAVTSTLRTEGEQIALYAQGREQLAAVNVKRRWAGMAPIGEKDNSYTVTNCDGVKVKSRHQSGLAIDVVPTDDHGNPIWPAESDPRWKIISAFMESVGFRWGGDWNGDGKTRYDGDKTETMVDYPHYELVD